MPEQVLKPFSDHNWNNAAEHTGGEAALGKVLTNTDKLAKGVAVAKPLSSSEYSEWGCTLKMKLPLIKNTWKYLRKTDF